jgi:hypothetical protein
MTAETETIGKEIEILVKDNMRFRFQLELSKTSDNGRKDTIGKILNNLDNKNTASEVDTMNKKNKIFDDLDKRIYSQPWTKLKSFQKETKIKDYVNEKFNSYVGKDQVLNLLMSALEKKELNKTSDVEYDTTNMKIINIPKLKQSDNGEYIMASIKATKVPKSIKSKTITK